MWRQEPELWDLFVACGGDKGFIRVADFYRAMAGKRKDQLRPLLKGFFGWDDHWKTIASALDTNNDDKIDFGEFVAGVKDVRKRNSPGYVDPNDDMSDDY